MEYFGTFMPTSNFSECNSKQFHPVTPASVMSKTTLSTRGTNHPYATESFLPDDVILEILSSYEHNWVILAGPAAEPCTRWFASRAMSFSQHPRLLFCDTRVILRNAYTSKYGILQTLNYGEGFALDSWSLHVSSDTGLVAHLTDQRSRT